MPCGCSEGSPGEPDSPACSQAQLSRGTMNLAAQSYHFSHVGILPVPLVPAFLWLQIDVVFFFVGYVFWSGNGKK